MMMGEGSGRPFTVTQLQELELQSLIFKCLASGTALPPDLTLGLGRSFLLPFLPHSSSVDAEPGRCRRTDGKKWRCSKAVHPNSKYCDRHMHRGKNRSRKPLELLSSSTVLHTHSFLLPCSSSPFHKCSDFKEFVNGYPSFGGQVEKLEVSSAEEARQRYGHRQVVHAHSGICLAEEDKEKERLEFGAHFEVANLEEEKTRNGRQFHWFLDEKPLKVEGSWMRVGLDQLEHI
ncbi:growth-regulating factor 4-like [Zingiber officinale]|uniref:growth-regulating factor 4-like n=1 Tax=Zingiber officinale TaxID=94328 RepID=UPI001C4D9C13|nr:growth-regulating factor 4-like [Zingiber officinale]